MCFLPWPFKAVKCCSVCERQEPQDSCSCLLDMISVYSCDEFGFKLPIKTLREEPLNLQWMLLSLGSGVSQSRWSLACISDNTKIPFEEENCQIFVGESCGEEQEEEEVEEVEEGEEGEDRKVWEAFFESLVHRCFPSL